MNGKPLFLKANKVGLALAAAFLLTLTGCVGYVVGPGAGGYSFAAQDDYVYYPQYQVYYSVSQHQYAYRDGNNWVSRPAPRGVSVDVLTRSPSVKMTFHDSPANHHAAVVKQYPKNWKPSGSNQGQKEKQKDDKQDDHGENNGR
jgi:hypothetical protein